jgi:hypothetical protein
MAEDSEISFSVGDPLPQRHSGERLAILGMPNGCAEASNSQLLGALEMHGDNLTAQPQKGNVEIPPRGVDSVLQQSQPPASGLAGGHYDQTS